MDTPNTLEMSDEDFLKMGAPTEVAASATADPTDPVEQEDGEAGQEQQTEQEGGQAEGAAEGETPEGQGEADGDEGSDGEAGQDPKSAEGEQPADPKAKAEEKPGEKAAEQTEAKKDGAEEPAKEAKAETTVDYADIGKKILAPFKANGKEIQVKSVDDAISLMQMGANYNKRMAALKPSMKFLKMLENNGLLDEEKLSFLIDLDKKSPEAISKLVKDSSIDPMDLSAEKASAYKRSSYTVDDREINLDTVLSEIKDSPTYTRTLEIVSDKWDSASKRILVDHPEDLKVLDGHVSSGVFDIVAAEMESERVFGRLNGLSDIEAYRKVADAINARGGFNHLFQGSSPAQGKPAAKEPIVIPAKPKKVEDDKLKEKRRAAGSTKPALPATTPKDFNPLSMSDADFEKLAAPRF